MRGFFVTATGTDAGKTVFSRALALVAREEGRCVAALKPIETGFVDAARSDAAALERSSSVPGLAEAPGLYRAAPPLAPAAVSLQGGDHAPDPAALAAACRRAAADADFVVVEGAGGLLVPLDDTHTVADLAVELALPVLLVAPDRLGVLSHVLTAWESAQGRGLDVRAVVLTDIAGEGADDPSPRTNRSVLQRWLDCEVHRLPHLPLDDAALAAAAGQLPWLRELC